MQEPLEQYIETVRAGLKQLPEEEREKEITELRQHLNASAQSRTELGDTEEAATASAVAQFGEASAVRQCLLATYWRRRLAAFQQSWLGAVACTLFAVYSVWTLVPILSDWERNPNLGYATFFVQCWLMGWLSFRLSGRRCLPVLASLSVWFNYYYIVHQFVRGPYSYQYWEWLIVIASGTLVLPVLAAYISLRRSLRPRKA